MDRDAFNAYQKIAGITPQAATEEQKARHASSGFPAITEEMQAKMANYSPPASDLSDYAGGGSHGGYGTGSYDNGTTKQSQYYNYVQGQEGWNSDWNQYQKQIMLKLYNPDYDLAQGGVPQDVIDSLSSFAGGIQGMDEWAATGYNPGVGAPDVIPAPPKGGVEIARGKEAQYANYLRSQEGWNPEWDRYAQQIMRKLQDPNYNMADNSFGPNGPMSAVPQEIIAQLSEFYGGVEPMSGEWGYQDPGATTQPGEYVDPGYGYVDPGADYYQNQMNILKEQGNLQELANRNAIKRQILARMMNKRSSLDA